MTLDIEEFCRSLVGPQCYTVQLTCLDDKGEMRREYSKTISLAVSHSLWPSAFGEREAYGGRWFM